MTGKDRCFPAKALPVQTAHQPDNRRIRRGFPARILATERYLGADQLEQCADVFRVTDLLRVHRPPGQAQCFVATIIDPHPGQVVGCLYQVVNIRAHSENAAGAGRYGPQDFILAGRIHQGGWSSGGFQGDVQARVRRPVLGVKFFCRHRQPLIHGLRRFRGQPDDRARLAGNGVTQPAGIDFSHANPDSRLRGHQQSIEQLVGIGPPAMNVHTGMPASQPADHQPTCKAAGRYFGGGVGAAGGHVHTTGATDGDLLVIL